MIAVWADDFSSVTVSRTCRNDESHKQSDKAEGEEITSEVTKEPTSTESGERTYSATVLLGDDEFTVTKTQIISALGSAVSGSIRSFGNETDEITVSLTLKNETSSSYETVAVNDQFSFSNVQAGTYTLSIAKKNHVTREYDVTVGAAGVVQDVEIRLLGDLNGDGKVTTVDAARANSHAKSVSLITDPYIFKCADANGNGTVTTVDAGRINSHARRVSLLWD